MKRWWFYIAFCFCASATAALSEYWLIQEDFIKLGKREFYLEKKQEDLSKQKAWLKDKKELFDIIGAEDLENPQYVFLAPLKNLASLSFYEPISHREKSRNVLLETTMHFQIFSLHQFLPECSLKEETVFITTKPYFFYALYDITLGSQEIFEKALKEASIRCSKDSISWCVFKSLLAGSTPKYLVCLSFATKEELKEWSMEKVLPEITLNDIFRDKKSGWMKRLSF